MANATGKENKKVGGGMAKLVAFHFILCYASSIWRLQIVQFQKLLNCVWNIRKESVLVADIESTRWLSWLTHYTKNQKVAGSSPDKVSGVKSRPSLKA
jgi:hypothetical protein